MKHRVKYFSKINILLGPVTRFLLSFKKFLFFFIQTSINGHMDNTSSNLFS